MKEVAKARLYSLQGPIDFINGPPHHPLITRLARRRRHGDGAGTLLIHERMAGGVNTPTTPGTPQHRHPTEVGGGAVVGAEVIPQPVLLRSVCRLVPMNGPVVGVGDGGDLIGEGHEVPCGCECIVAGQAAKRSA